MHSHHENTLRVATLMLACKLFDVDLHAATVVSNLDQAEVGGIAVTDGVRIAMQFTVGSQTGPWRLDRVELRISASFATARDFSVELRSDAAGMVGEHVSSFSGPDPILLSVSNYTFIPVSEFVLLPGSSYWLSVTSSTSSSDGLNIGYGWSATNTFAQSGSTDWAISDGFAYSSDTGLSWTFEHQEPCLFAIQATAIPEPDCIEAVAVGTFMLFLRRNRCLSGSSRELNQRTQRNRG